MNHEDAIANQASEPEQVSQVSQERTRQKIALGIVTYNNEEAQLNRLQRSLELSAEHLAEVGCEACVQTIDCGCNTNWDSLRLPIDSLPFEGNLGFGRGMNRLMRRAFADPAVAWFLCINPDGALHSRLLVEMVTWSRRYPDSLVEARQFPEEHPKPYDLETGATLWASGACLLIPRIIYETIGGFDPHMFMYMEDVDYSWEARLAGFSVRVAPRALFGHSVLDRPQDSLIEKYYFFSARYLAHKWCSPGEQRTYERVICDRGWGLPGELPPLPPRETDRAAVVRRRSIADFSYGFVFSPRRW